MLNLAINYLSLLLFEMWSLCLEMAPFLLMGMVISGLISMFIDSRFIMKHLGSKNLLSIFIIIINARSPIKIKIGNLYIKKLKKYVRGVLAVS